VDAAPAGVPAGQTRIPRSARRVFGVAAGAAAALITASCAAGQHAQTAYEHPTPQNFAYADVGALRLRAVAVQAPDHAAGGATNYPAGSAVPLTVAIVNTGGSADTLRNVSSPAFTGWGVYPTSAIVQAASSSSVSSAPSSASPSSAPPASTPSVGAPAARTVTIPPGESVRLGIVDQTGSDTRTGSDVSAQTIVLTGLHGKTYAPLYPSTVVPITFTFARNGSATLKVPVQLTAPSPGVTIPTQTTVANGD
jgi:copper(I)-binding protein